MKSNCLLALMVLSILLAEKTFQDNLEYNFEIQNGLNTLVVSKEDEKTEIKKSKATSEPIHLKKSKTKKSKKSNKDDLSKMVKLGVLIDRITNRLEKDETKKNKQSLVKKEMKTSIKPRKAFGMTEGLALGGGAALAVGAGVMAGSAENDAIQNQIDAAKMEQTVLYIKDRIEQESNDLLNKSNRGFGTLKVKAHTLITNFELTFNIAYDHVGKILDDMENDYDNVGATNNPA